MITLYQFHWSHYVEKVRWALDYKGVEWRAVDVEPFTKREMRGLPYKTTLDTGQRLRTVPMIQDDATGTVLGESSEILAYLERQYPAPALYPELAAEREEVVRWLRWLDSEIGLRTRRLGYTQIALEDPVYLAQLFIPHIRGVKAMLAGASIAGTLTQRFRFHRNREDRVYERLEQCLLFAARRLGTQRYLVGQRFTAADLTLAALLRPITVVPLFRDHPKLQKLFEWREALLREQRREPHISYENALHAIRRRRGWALGSVSWLDQPREEGTFTELPALSGARNDQQPVGRWPFVSGPLWYLRLRSSCRLGRTSVDGTRYWAGAGGTHV